MSDSHHLERRDFVKVIVAFVGSVIGVVVGLPAIGYLISPATKNQASEAWIPLGPLENYQVDTPTLFSFTRSKTNGWEKTANSYGAYPISGKDYNRKKEVKHTQNDNRNRKETELSTQLGEQAVL